MEDEVIRRFSKFKLIGQENEGIKLETPDISQCIEECERSLLVKIWGEKTVNFTGLKNTLSPLWCPKGVLKVIELGSNFYQFVFSKEEEKERVLLRRPWVFDNQLLVLQNWHPDLKESDPCFCKAQMWIHVKGLPHHWSSKEVGWKIGKLFPSCLNVVVPENGSKEGKIIKLLVDIKLDQPLLRGTKISMEEKTVWVDFAYEHLPMFCFYCGYIGHPECLCQKKVDDARKNRICEGQYGEWMKVITARGGKRGGTGEKTTRKEAGVLLSQFQREDNREDITQEVGEKISESLISSSRHVARLAKNRTPDQKDI